MLFDPACRMFARIVVNLLVFLRGIYWSVCFIWIIFLTGCLPSPHYQKAVVPPGQRWSVDYKPAFRFEVNDTAARYHMYFLIRHTDVYPFSNIWLKIYTRKPGDKVFDVSRIEIPLAEPNGRWLGRGMGGIWEQRMPITRDNAPMRFPRAGVYELRFEQCMRIDPLPEVMQVGLRVEQIGRVRK